MCWWSSVERHLPCSDPGRLARSGQKALKDRPIESLVHLDADGLAVLPLYAAANCTGALSAPRAQDADGRAWELRTLIESDDPEAVNAAVLADLEGGAASIILSGAVLADSEPLTRALNGVAMELAPVALDARLDGPDAANALAVAAKGSPLAKLMFHLDPISAFAAARGSPLTIEEHVTLVANTAACMRGPIRTRLSPVQRPGRA